MRTFSLLDELPVGTTVLEASAGTGKTYTIAALAARFLAEGRAGVGDLLLVTFSRSATAELRSRVRERIRTSERALRVSLEDGEPREPVDALLAAGTAAQVRVRADRLATALNHFDRATIMTTHEFCHGMLHGLGVLAPQTPQSDLAEDLTWLADEASADLYLQRYADAPRPPPFRYLDGDGGRDDPGARTLGRDAVRVDAAIGPLGAEGVAAERVAFASAVRAEVVERKRRLRLYSFDDQLARLRDALADGRTGEAARRKLATRYPVVLVDEFQDTDPVQWEILQQAFVGASTVILIGDPKQAIYAFRGADVHTYTAAVHRADTTITLNVNHRADRGVVDAVGALFAGVRLGEEIEVPTVHASHDARLLAAPGTPWAAGLQIRVIEHEESVSPWQAHDEIGHDLVHVVARLLSPEQPLHHRDGARLSPNGIAVLVRSNDRGHDLAHALNAAGIAATFSGTNSVFLSAAAADWLALLRALDQTRRPYVQRAVLTDFLGAGVRDLVDASDERWGQWSVRLHTWARILERSGVPALMTAFDRDTGFTARLLARPHGERLVTDHRHLAELLHRRADRPATHVRDLEQWLTAAIDEANVGTERTRRLETDGDAVQIMTIHRAKGLQWPVVLLPEASHSAVQDEDKGRALVLPGADGREVDVGGRRDPGRATRWRLHRQEEADEALRSLYVGLTRAQSHVVAWWSHHWNTSASPLHRLLQAHREPAPGQPEPARPEVTYPTRDLPDGGSPLALVWPAGAGIAVVRVGPPPPDPPSAASSRTDPLAVRDWTRAIDQSWRRTSYSGLTAAAHDLPYGFGGPAEDEAALLEDEGGDEVVVVVVATDPQLAQPSPMAALPGGAAFGTLVHAVYEQVDATGSEWRADLAGSVADALRRWPVPGVEALSLARAMEPSFETPLGPLAPGLTLRDVRPADRLSELDFEFPLDHPSATLADVAALWARHLTPGDPLAAYPARLTGPTLAGQRLRGFLTGSIDAVLRRPGGGFLVVDYKTNRLGGADLAPEKLTVGHYTPRVLADAMMASHYPLQALLYCVALHRFLRQRHRSYEPERDLAGAAYLFVRGMAGPATPVIDGHPLGVFSWRPSAALVRDVSLLLAGGRP